MRVPDRCVADLRQRGYLVFEGFLTADEVASAQEALWLHYPRPEEYFADPAQLAGLATRERAGICGAAGEPVGGHQRRTVAILGPEPPGVPSRPARSGRAVPGLT